MRNLRSLPRAFPRRALRACLAVVLSAFPAGLGAQPEKSGAANGADDEGLPLAVDRWVPIDMTEGSGSRWTSVRTARPSSSTTWGTCSRSRSPGATRRSSRRGWPSTRSRGSRPTARASSTRRTPTAARTSGSGPSTGRRRSGSRRAPPTARSRPNGCRMATTSSPRWATSGAGRCRNSSCSTSTAAAGSSRSPSPTT